MKIKPLSRTNLSQRTQNLNDNPKSTTSQSKLNKKSLNLFWIEYKKAKLYKNTPGLWTSLTRENKFKKWWKEDPSSRASMDSIALKKWLKGSSSRTRICQISQELLVRTNPKLTKLGTISIPCWFPSTTGKKLSGSSWMSVVIGEGYLTIDIHTSKSQNLKKNSINTEISIKINISSRCTPNRLFSSISSTRL